MSAVTINFWFGFCLIYVFLFLAVVDCGTLNATANGQVSHPNGTTFGQTATYSCDTGYNLLEDITRTCQANGVWSGNEPTCISESNLLKMFKAYPKVASIIGCLYTIKLC